MTPENDKSTFDEWCIVEIMGHQQMAGRVREVSIAGAGLLRVDVPALDEDVGGFATEPWTTYLSPSSIYRLTPVEEVVARAMARRLRIEPISRWTVKEMMPTLLPAPDDPEDDSLVF